MKVLVTGCQGQVGRRLVEQLHNLPEIQLFPFNKQTLDIANEEQVNSILNEISPDVVINAAAYTAVDKAEQEKALAFAINSEGPANLARVAARHNALLLHISTDYVFDGLKTSPYQELDDTNPQTVYGQSKMAGEQAIQSSGCRHVILRTAWVFEEQGHNFVNTMLRLAETKTELGIVADQIGGPTYADDIASALVEMMFQLQATKHDCKVVVHFSGAPHCSWFDFAEEVFDSAIKTGRLKKRPTLEKIKTADYPLPAPRPSNSMLDCSKIRAEFGIEPSDWKLGLSRVMKYVNSGNQA